MEFSDFFGETEHFSGKIRALKWSILVGKWKNDAQIKAYLSLNLLSYFETISRDSQVA